MKPALGLALPALLLISNLLAQCSPQPGKHLFPITVECDSERLAGITVDAATSQAAGAAEVLKLRPLKADANRIRTFAMSLGLSSQPVESTAPEGRKVLEVLDPKGRLSLSEDTGELQFDSSVPVNPNLAAIPVDQAEQRAIRLFAGPELMPQAELTVTTENVGDFIQVTMVGAKSPPADRRDGQFISVLLYPDGQLKGFTYFWREPQDAGSYPIISSADAQARLSKCYAVIRRTTMAGDNNVDSRLTSVRLGYLQTRGADGDYLVPAFVFESSTMLGDFPQTEAIVPALDDPFVAFLQPDSSRLMP